MKIIENAILSMYIQQKKELFKIKIKCFVFFKQLLLGKEKIQNVILSFK